MIPALRLFLTLVAAGIFSASCTAEQDLGNRAMLTSSGAASPDASPGMLDPDNLTHCQQVCLQFGPEECTRICLRACGGGYGSGDCESKLAGVEPVGIVCEGSLKNNVAFLTASSSSSSTCSFFSGGKYTGALPDGGWNQNKRIFVTTGSWSGTELRTAGGTGRGTTSADALCQREADGDARGGTWKAWLSDTRESAATHVVGDGPWYLADRSAIAFRNRAAWNIGPLFALGNGTVWTGSDMRGNRKEPNPGDGSSYCGEWSAAAIGGRQGIVGNAAIVKAQAWTDSAGAYCTEAHHLYCFEQ
jgi:hypothetical protein